MKITTIFSPRKFTRALQRQPDRPEWVADLPNMWMPSDLSPMLYNVYLYILQHDVIRLSDVDFEELDEDGLHHLYKVLEDSPVNDLLKMCESFRHFNPAASEQRVFI